MNKFFNYFPIVLIAICSCNKSSAQTPMMEIDKNEVLKKHFTPKEIIQLGLILNYVDSIVLEGEVSQKRVKKEYSKNLNRILNSAQTNRPFFDFYKSIELFAQLDKPLFNKIWQFRMEPHRHEGHI